MSWIILRRSSSERRRRAAISLNVSANLPSSSRAGTGTRWLRSPWARRRPAASAAIRMDLRTDSRNARSNGLKRLKAEAETSQPTVRSPTSMGRPARSSTRTGTRSPRWVRSGSSTIRPRASASMRSYITRTMEAIISGDMVCSRIIRSCIPSIKGEGSNPKARWIPSQLPFWA